MLRLFVRSQPPCAPLFVRPTSPPLHLHPSSPSASFTYLAISCRIPKSGADPTSNSGAGCSVFQALGGQKRKRERDWEKLWYDARDGSAQRLFERDWKRGFIHEGWRKFVNTWVREAKWARETGTTFQITCHSCRTSSREIQSRTGKRSGSTRQEPTQFTVMQLLSLESSSLPMLLAGRFYPQYTGIPSGFFPNRDICNCSFVIILFTVPSAVQALPVKPPDI